MAKIVGLGGVFFKARDPKALAEWYQQKLGMNVAFPNGVIFNKQDIPDNGYNLWAAFSEDTEYFKPSSKAFMINLMVDDLQGMLSQLRERGVDVDEKTESSEFGEFGWFQDPEGNRVELWQPPQNAPQA